MKLPHISTLVFVFHFFGDANCHEDSHPQININQFSHFRNGSFSFTQKPVFYSLSIGGELFLSCQSTSPIQWSIDGIVTPIDLVKLWSVGPQNVNSTYKIIAKMYFYDARAHPNLGASLRVSCHLENDTSIADEVFVFVQGHTNNSLVSSKNPDFLYDTMVIPCLTKNPTKIPQLYMVGEEGEEKLVDPSKQYLHTVGFLSNDTFSGKYICREDSYSLSFQTARNAKSSSNFDVFPKNPIILNFTDTNIRIECHSINGTQVYLQLNRDSIIQQNITLEYERNTTTSVILLLSSSSDSLGFSGTIRCLSDQGQQVFRWTLDLVRAPEFYIDNFSQELQCLSPAPSRKIETVWCKNPLDCKFKKRCFGDQVSCNFKQQKKFFSTYNATCWQEKYQTVRACAYLSAYHLHGSVRCSVGKLNREWEYFTALNSQKYTFWQDAPTSALLRIETTDGDMPHAGQLTSFYCLASSYLFTKELLFRLNFRNGSYINLPGISIGEKITSGPGQNAPIRIKNWNFVQQLDVRIPTGAAQLECEARWWNSTEVLKVTKDLK